MSIADSFLPELDREMAVTRRVLERVPDDDPGWRPHERSSSISGLATHVANLPSWVAQACELGELDLAPDGIETYKPMVLESQDERLALFDEHVTKARDVLSRTDDAALAQPWTLKVGGQEVFTLTKADVLRIWMMNHLIHHRGQLTVYLRLREQPVPAMYGPSADEQM